MIKINRYFVKPMIILIHYLNLPLDVMCKGYDEDYELFTGLYIDDLNIDFINDDQYEDFQIWRR